VGGLIAIAVFGIIMLAVFNSSLDNRLYALNLPTEIRQQVDSQRTRLASIEIPASTSAEQKEGLRSAIDTAFVDGFRWVALISGALAWASALCAWALVEGKRVVDRRS
jgi:hypothetical protein